MCRFVIVLQGKVKMKTKYSFEKEVIKQYNDDFEPIGKAYRIDDLNEKDREFLSGAFWAINELNNFKADEINNNNGTIGKIYNEYLVGMLERFEVHIKQSIRNLVIGYLDNKRCNDE